MIPRAKLKFNETDLKFFDKQLEDKSNILSGIHQSMFDFFRMNARHKYISGREIARRFGIKDIEVRAIIKVIRRYWKTDEDEIAEAGDKYEKYFITANRRGYTLSEVNCCDNCNNAIIDYFNKTQLRWKETFYELKNLMKKLNMIK